MWICSFIPFNFSRILNLVWSMFIFYRDSNYYSTKSCHLGSWSFGLPHRPPAARCHTARRPCRCHSFGSGVQGWRQSHCRLWCCRWLNCRTCVSCRLDAAAWVRRSKVHLPGPWAWPVSDSHPRNSLQTSEKDFAFHFDLQASYSDSKVDLE